MGGVYTAVMGPSSGPEVTLFIRFQREWPSMDHEKYSNVLHSLDGMNAIESEKSQEIIQLAQRHIDVSNSCYIYFKNSLKQTIILKLWLFFVYHIGRTTTR